MTRKWFKLYNLKDRALVADAEMIPFRSDSFDFISCNDALHHTPDTQKGINEIYRVLKPGGKALITFYFKSWMLKKGIFPITVLVMRLLRIKTPHGIRASGQEVSTLEELAR